MKKELQKVTIDISVENLNKFYRTGDVINFTDVEKIQVMHMLCKRLELDPITRPLDLIKLPPTNKTPEREIWYLTASGCEMIAAKWKMSFKIKEKGVDRDSGIAYFIIEGTIPETNRTDEATAYVQCLTINPKGEKELFFGTNMANALMKCETKARRRLIKRLTGLDYIDEDDLPDKKELDKQTKADALNAAMLNVTPKEISEPVEEIEFYDRTRPPHKVILKEVCENAGLSLKNDIEYIRLVQDRIIAEKVQINVKDPVEFTQLVNQIIHVTEFQRKQIINESDDL